MSPDSQRANTFCSSGEAAVCGGNWPRPRRELVIHFPCGLSTLPTSFLPSCTNPVLGRCAPVPVPASHWLLSLWHSSGVPGMGKPHQPAISSTLLKALVLTFRCAPRSALSHNFLGGPQGCLLTTTHKARVSVAYRPCPTAKPATPLDSTIHRRTRKRAAQAWYLAVWDRKKP